MVIEDLRPPKMPAEGPPSDVVIEQLWPLFQAGFLHEAQNYSLPVTSALGILASQPPPADMPSYFPNMRDWDASGYGRSPGSPTRDEC